MHDLIPKLSQLPCCNVYVPIPKFVLVAPLNFCKRGNFININTVLSIVIVKLQLLFYNVAFEDS